MVAPKGQSSSETITEAMINTDATVPSVACTEHMQQWMYSQVSSARMAKNNLSPQSDEFAGKKSVKSSFAFGNISKLNTAVT